MSLPLQLFDPDGTPDRVTSASTLDHFFQHWYREAVVDDPTRKSVSEKTIKRRAAAVGWWTQIMSCEPNDPSQCLPGVGQPGGPALFETAASHLTYFRDQLQTAVYKRGPRGPERRLSPVSQQRTLEEVQIVLAACGPTEPKKVRADLIASPPTIYLEAVNCFPKPTWTFLEAQKIATTAGTCSPPRFWPLSRQAWHCLSQATIAFWFYTGHRASTLFNLNREACTEPKPGMRCLDIIASVKTGKLDRVPIHSQLWQCLQSCWQCEDLAPNDRLIAWPIKYDAVVKHHFAWQEKAGLTEHRRFSPQAWRRLHSEEMEATAYRIANELASKSLGHGSESTTRASYSLSLARLRLPDLFSRQKMLF